MSLRKKMELVGDMVISELQSALITPPTGSDLKLEAVSGKDVKIKLAADDNTRKLSIIDSSDVEKAKIDGAGTVTGVAFAGNLTGNVTGNVTGNITGSSSANLAVTAGTARDVVVKLSDAAGAKKLSITDSANSEVASINSDGKLTAVKVDAAAIEAPYDSGAGKLVATLTAEFGDPADLGDGWIGVWKDTADSNKIYFVTVVGGAYYLALATAAAAE